MDFYQSVFFSNSTTSIMRKTNGGVESSSMPYSQAAVMGNHVPPSGGACGPDPTPTGAATLTCVKNWWKNQMECESSDEEEYIMDFPAGST